MDDITSSSENAFPARTSLKRYPELIPGLSLGRFRLGLTLHDCMQLIVKPTKSTVIPSAVVKYDDKDPLEQPYVLELSEDGVVLMFEPKTQILFRIEIYELSKCPFVFSGQAFNLEHPPTLVNLNSKFGPTFSGVLDRTSGDMALYWLNYPGLSFAFEVPEQFEKMFEAKNDDFVPPVEFPNRTSPLSRRVVVYQSPPGQHRLEKSIVPTPISKVVLGELVVTPGADPVIRLPELSSHIHFDQSPQDITSILGPPSAVFEKQEDKMKIHTHSFSGLGCTDYFYNYFQFGIDILFDVKTHLVKKIILHTNFPGHHEFGFYAKCQFSLHFMNQVFTPTVKWKEILAGAEQQSIKAPKKPLVHNSGSSLNPFGSTLFYGFRDFVVEVMANGHIASICLFKNDK